MLQFIHIFQVMNGPAVNVLTVFLDSGKEDNILKWAILTKTTVNIFTTLQIKVWLSC